MGKIKQHQEQDGQVDKNQDSQQVAQKNALETIGFKIANDAFHTFTPAFGDDQALRLYSCVVHPV